MSACGPGCAWCDAHPEKGHPSETCDWGFHCPEPVAAHTLDFERRPFCERHVNWHIGCMTGRGLLQLPTPPNPDAGTARVHPTER